MITVLTSKAVLLLGRFKPERKAILERLKVELRKFGYIPILFDFSPSLSRDTTETVTLLARMTRFIIADLTDPSSIPKELEAIVPMVAVPIQPLIHGVSRSFSMFSDYWKYDWVLKLYQYDTLEGLIANIEQKVIAPAEAKVRELEAKRLSSLI